MARTKVRGITIEIGGDTSELSKSLKNVNSDISKTQKELKDVEKLLKLDPKNTDLLAQKQELLSKRVTETSNKLETLKKTQEEFVKNGGEVNSEQYRALAREIESTRLYLKDAEKNAKDFNVTMAKVSATAGEVADKAGAVAEKTKALSAVAGGAVAGLAGLAYNSVKSADELNTLAKQTGLSTEELQKFSYASDLVDVSVESITGAVTKLKSKMGGDSDVFAQLGVSVRDMNGQLRDADTVFYESLEALSRIQNETERDAVAMQLFGKSADELAGIIDDGGASLKAFGEEAENLGIVIDQDTLDALNEVNDQIDKLKAQLKGELAVAGAKAMEALMPAFEDLVEVVRKALDWIGGLNTTQIKLFAGLATGVALISPVAGAISGISKAVKTIIDLNIVGKIGTLKKGLTGLFTVISANPVVLAISAIVIAVTALGVILYKNRDKVKEVVENIVQKVKDGVNLIIGYINGLIDKINSFIEKINSVTQAINSKIGTNIGQIGTIGNIPMLANGGVLSSGSAIVGERGAELLTLVNGEAVVRPLTNNTTNNAVSNATYNYNFSVDSFETFQRIENKLQNERITMRMGYIGG